MFPIAKIRKTFLLQMEATLGFLGILFCIMCTPNPPIDSIAACIMFTRFLWARLSDRQGRRVPVQLPGKVLVVTKKKINEWEDHLVVQAELKLCVHGADLDGEDLAHLLPPEHQVVQRHLWGRGGWEKKWQTWERSQNKRKGKEYWTRYSFGHRQDILGITLICPAYIRL